MSVNKNGRINCKCNGNISKILSKYLEKKYQIIAYVSFKKFVKSKNFNGRPLIAENIKKNSPKL